MSQNVISSALASPLPVEDVAGNASGIDDGRQAEADLAEALRNAERELTLLAALQNAAPVGLAFVDRDFRLVRVNPALAAMGQRTVHELVGRPVAELAPEMWETLEPAYRDILATGEAVLNLALTAGRDLPDACELVASHYPVRSGDEIIGIGVVAVDRRVLSDVRSESALPPTARLTAREQDVLECLREGLSNPAIARRLGVTANTVRNHVQRILHKLNVHSKLEAVVVTSREGRPGRK